MRALFLCLFAATAPTAHAQNVLAERPPSRAEAVTDPHRLTDRVNALEGAGWNGPSASLLLPGAEVEWDLGAPTLLTGAAIQADSNDVYLLSISDDGRTWRDFTRFGGVERSGLRTRSASELNVTARFVRLSASGDDGRYSVSELELFAGSTDGSTLLRWKWVPRRPLEQTFLAWVLGMWALLALASRRLSRAALGVLAASGLLATAWLVFERTPSTPDFVASVPWVRAAVALTAMAAVLREWLWRKSWPAHGGFVIGTLGVTGVMACWCFLNLGQPQYRDAGAGRGTWLHHYDLRSYYPTARYFPELRLDGVYAASVLAVAEGRGLEAFDDQPLRDLKTDAMTTVRDSKAYLLEVRARFTPERWALFLEDMGYFRRAMGDERFLVSMDDHGGNATPVWFLTARALFASSAASDATFWRGVAADVLLLVLAFLALGWAWGARTALVALTVFGAMDFYQFGNNWFGATLRHDWLALWAIGLALLQKEKLVWAGAAIAWSAWLRAFPALTLVTLSFPVLWAGGNLLLQKKGSEALAASKPLLRVALGVVLASAALVGLSIEVFGFEAWTEWLRKVQILDRIPRVNNLAFRTHINPDKLAWVAACAVSMLALFWALRRASLPRAAVWGVALVPIILNPSGYFLHCFFLLTTLAAERPSAEGPRTAPRGALVWLVVLGTCVASYFTNLTADVETHFRLDTWVLFGSLGALLLLELGARVRSKEAAFAVQQRSGGGG